MVLLCTTVHVTLFYSIGLLKKINMWRITGFGVLHLSVSLKTEKFMTDSCTKVTFTKLTQMVVATEFFLKDWVPLKL